MGTIKAINKDLWFETKTILPFEENTYLDKVPLVVEVHNASEQSDFDYINEHKQDCDKERDDFYGHLRYQNSKNKVNFYKLLYFICDSGTGIAYPHYFCSDSHLRYTVGIDNRFKDRIVHYERIRDKHKKISNDIISTIVIGDTLVFRFFSYSSDFFNRGEIRGYYETHRVCFRGMESWGENRETLYRFDNRYMCERNKTLYSFKNYRDVDCYDAAKHILEVYPIIKDECKNLYRIKKYHASINELFSIDISDLNNNIFLAFCTVFNRLNKNEDLFKNVPKNIKKDCQKRHTLPSNIKKWFNSYYTKCVQDNDNNYGYNFNLPPDADLGECIVFDKKDDYVVARLFRNDEEYEKIYYTKDKIYKMVYSGFYNKFVSTKSEHMNMFRVNSKFIFAPFMRHSYQRKDGNATYRNCLDDVKNTFKETIYRDYVKDTILSRYTYLDGHFNFLYNIEQQHHYLFLEQMLKQGYFALYKDMVFNFNRFQAIMLNETFMKKNKCQYTLRTLQNLSFKDILFVKSGEIKFIDKNITIGDWERIVNCLFNKTFTSTFPDRKLCIVMAQATYEQSKLRKIIKVYKQCSKDYYKFFLALSNKRSTKEITRLMDLYIDYWKFMDKANKYGAFKYPVILKPSEIEFMHDKSYRDYMYQLEIAKSKGDGKKKPVLTKEMRFANFVNSEEYTKFLYDGKQDEDFSVVGAKMPMDLIDEGRALSHCVGSYVGRMAKKRSYIYFLREKKDIYTPYYTMEVQKRKQTVYDKKSKLYVYKDIYLLNQCYGPHDTTDKTSQCASFIKKWCRTNHITIKCAI